MKLKIAIVVHGRFHAFDLARALLGRGHHVTLFTNYPQRAAERFLVSRVFIRSFWPHGILSRIAAWLSAEAGIPYPEEALHRMFACWAANQIRKEQWDVVHAWSGVAEETFMALESTGTLRLLMRGSSHIRTQARLLEEEERRAGTPLDRPSPWMIAREEREYGLADRIATLSRFANDSFVKEGVPLKKLSLIPLGVQVGDFRPTSSVIEDRCRRILSEAPLRILYVGAISFQKGFWDMDEVLRGLKMDRFHFRFIGPVAPEVRGFLPKLRTKAEFVPKQPQQKLPSWYAWGDLFLSLTIQDGFSLVLSQANAGALPILTTMNCSGPDFVQEGKNGWILPIRQPKAFMERLIWCDRHRQDLATMVRWIYEDFQPRGWEDVAEDFESVCTKLR